MEFCESNQTGVVILNETNKKWKTRTTDAMSSKTKAVVRETRSFYEDNKAHKITRLRMALERTDGCDNRQNVQPN